MRYKNLCKYCGSELPISETGWYAENKTGKEINFPMYGKCTECNGEEEEQDQIEFKQAMEDFAGCRYSEILHELLDEYNSNKILSLVFESNWQGFVDIYVKTLDDKIIHCYYVYGSCSGCDAWDGMSNSEVKEELKKLLVFMTEEDYSKIDTKKKYQVFESLDIIIWK